MAKYKLIVALQLNTGLHSNPVCFNGVFILQTCELTHTHTRLHSGLIQTKMSTSDTTCVLVVTWKCSEGKHGKKNKKKRKAWAERRAREVVIAVPNLCSSSYISASSSFSGLELQIVPTER